MKKLFLFLLAFGLTLCFSCKKCATCTETHTHTTSSFCGGPAALNTYTENLKTTGAAVGQNWTCTTK